MRLGADPEVFLVNSEGKHISVIGLINADKWNPLQIKGMPKGFTLQEDNVALEYGIPPASNADEFAAHIQQVMDKSKEWLPGLSFSKLACTIFPADQMKHPAAHIFGCEPDFNAWTNETNVKPSPPYEFMRSAGGHIHVETDAQPDVVARYMDLYLGVPSTLMDKDEGRKKLYGKMGAYRPKPYGVEYRVLSNFWIFKPELIRWAWRATEAALASKVKVHELQPYIEEAINNGDKDMARMLVKEYNLEVL
jgi:hypothetical protein